MFPPPWVDYNSIFFVTICTTPRRTNHLCEAKISKAIFAATEHYHRELRWYVHLLLLMPDHLHAMISFPKTESMKEVIRAWKHYLAKKHHINWQRDFFDHRIRHDESLEEKTSYIRLNPVRAGLIASAELWPYVWEPNR